MSPPVTYWMGYWIAYWIGGATSILSATVDTGIFPLQSHWLELALQFVSYLFGRPVCAWSGHTLMILLMLSTEKGLQTITYSKSISETWVNATAPTATYSNPQQPQVWRHFSSEKGETWLVWSQFSSFWYQCLQGLAWEFLSAEASKSKKVARAYKTVKTNYFFCFGEKICSRQISKWVCQSVFFSTAQNL